MPNKETFSISPIKELLNQEIIGLVVDPFSRNNSFAQITNDIDPNTLAKFHKDALEFLKGLDSEYADTILFDPPYSITQAQQCYNSHGKEKLKISVSNMKYWSSIKNEMARILKPKGKAICFGWSSMGLGIKRGFTMTRILLVPHGGTRNDTLCTVEIKNIPS